MENKTACATNLSLKHCVHRQRLQWARECGSLSAHATILFFCFGSPHLQLRCSISSEDGFGQHGAAPHITAWTQPQNRRAGQSTTAERSTLSPQDSTAQHTTCERGLRAADLLRQAQTEVTLAKSVRCLHNAQRPRLLASTEELRVWC